MSAQGSRRWRVALIICLVLATLYTAYRLTLNFMVQAKLNAIRKQGYPVTLAELDVWYPQVPPSANAAVVFSNAFSRYVWDGEHYDLLRSGKIMLSSSSGPVVEERRGSLPYRMAKLPLHGEALTSEMNEVMAKLIAENQEGLSLLHEVGEMKQCRYPVDLKNGLVAFLPHLTMLSRGVRLLQLEAILHAESQKPDSATRSIATIFGLAQSLNAEPLLISQLHRMTCIAIALDGLERTMNRTQITDASLRELATKLRQATTSDGIIRALAGERCMYSDLYRQPTDFQLAQLGPPPPSKAGGFESYAGFLFLRRDRWKYPILFNCLKAAGLMSLDHATYLDTMHLFIQAARSPFPQSLKAAAELHEIIHLMPKSRVVSRYLLCYMDSNIVRQAKNVARIRAALTAVAVERYRLTKGRLPNELTELETGLPERLPEDPFIGEPLHYKKLPKGYVVYSVGEDGNGDGGDEKKDITFMVER